MVLVDERVFLTLTVAPNYLFYRQHPLRIGEEEHQQAVWWGGRRPVHSPRRQEARAKQATAAQPTNTAHPPQQRQRARKRCLS